MTQPKTDLAYLRSEKAKAEQQLRYYQHREKILEHQIPELTRKARVHRLCTRAGMLESFLIAPEELTNDQVMPTQRKKPNTMFLFVPVDRHCFPITFTAATVVQGSP